MISEKHYKIIQDNKDRLDSAIVYDTDFEYQYFGFKTLERSYLLKINGKVVERPQQMLMRVSVGIHGEDIEAAVETYDLLSKKLFTHASPTLFNAATPRPQLSSCFRLTIHNIRASGTYIAGPNGNSNGLMPMLRVFNNTARYVDQGGNKRPGAFAIYLEPWHADVFDFLDLKK